MLGGKANSASRPTALGAMTQAGTYGMAIPNIYGMMKSSLLAIWMQNLRQGGSGKKGKKAKKGKGVPTYIVNADFLLGCNPILGLMQAWQNTTKLPLNFIKASYTPSAGANITIVDSHFYAVVAVTVTNAFSESFNDYGNPNGPQSVSGSFEVPLWNISYNGPDPTNSSDSRFFPFIYDWNPAYGTTVELPGNILGSLPTANVTYNVYYAQTNASVMNHESPATYLRVTFEPTLADGPEYQGTIDGTNGTPLDTQQVLMPPYAGAGSAEFDLGALGALADVRVEVQGSYGVYPSGDADFADMIESIVKAGVTQVNPAATSAEVSGPVDPLQQGVSAFSFPGPVQKKFRNSLYNYTAAAFDRLNQTGNILVAYWQGSQNGSATPTISSTNEGSSWTAVDVGTQGGSGFGWGLWWTTAVGGGLNTVTIGGVSGYNNTLGLLELAGLDTFDNSLAVTVTGTSFSENLALSTANGQADYVMTFVCAANAVGEAVVDPRWNNLWNTYQNTQAYFFSLSRTFYAPTTANVQASGFGSPFTRVLMLAFKLVAPPSTPNPFGPLLDDTSMALCRTQARAYGLWGSISLQTQKAARDWLKDLYASMNSAPFYSGNRLKQVPYGETSAAANGAVYIAATANGPLANLSAGSSPEGDGPYGDFLGDKSTPPVTIERKAQFDAFNILQMQIPARSSDYNPVVVSQPEPGSLALYGVRKDSPQDREEITDTSVARILLGIAVRRQSYIRNTLKFKLGPARILFEPMDLVTVSEPWNALANYPVRFTSISVGADWQATCEAEPFVFGVHTPNPVTAADTAPYQPPTLNDPGQVNTPIIFEPVPRLYGTENQPQLWMVVSGASENYGGCIVYISTDGGNSYNSLGTINGNAPTGYTTADWPADTDPDTTNNLAIDLTESLGELESYMAADRDAFSYPCYVEGGNASIPYALMTYNSAVLTSANKYTLQAMGTGNELRRCVFGAPVAQPGPDVDHPGPTASPVTLGSRFAFLGSPTSPIAAGILKVTMDPRWIGVELYFKFLPFNTYNTIVESLSATTPYTYTPTGTPGTLQQPGPNNYSQDPAIDLSQPTGTTIHMAQVVTTFAGNSVTYNARTFTITNPISATTYYVTIADPGMVGDTGSGTNLTATCQTSDALVGVPGNTYIGLIQCVTGGGSGATPGPGGYPPPQSSFVTP